MKTIKNHPIRGILPALLALFILASCQKQSTPPGTPTLGFRLPPEFTPTLTATPMPGTSGEFNLGKALELLCGEEGKLETDSQGGPVIRVAGEPGGGEARDEIIRPLLAVPFNEENEEKYILLTETGPDGMGAHAEYALIGGALFHKILGAWEIEIQQRVITWMGSFGHAPDGELQAIGPDKHGFLFKPEWSGQGSSSQNAVLIGIVGLEFKVIFLHEIRVHGEAGDAVWDYSSEMEFLPGSNSEYFTIQVTTKGTRPEVDIVAPFEEVEVFEFDGQEYVSTG